MRSTIFLVLVLNSVLAISQSAEFYFLDKTNHKWEDTNEGVQLEKSFRFINSGDVPLIIKGANVACSCTRVDYPKNPVAPGDTSKITIHFDTNQKYYYQNRSVEIVSNAKKKTKLKFKVYVIPKDEE